MYKHRTESDEHALKGKEYISKFQAKKSRFEFKAKETQMQIYDKMVTKLS